MPSASYELIAGDLHRHGSLSHAHQHDGPHEHSYAHSPHEHHHSPHEHHHSPHEHHHSHGLVHESIKRSREGVKAVTLALVVLAGAALLQAAVFVLSGSVALLADLIHNGGDALTAFPLGVAFALHSRRAERLAGLAVVAAIFLSACVAGYEALARLIHPSTPGHLLVLAAAGAMGFAGNWLAALVRLRAGRQLHSTALLADGEHARADAYVSLAVIASAIAIAAGAPLLDPLIGLGMTVVILRITRESWLTIRGRSHHH